MKQPRIWKDEQGDYHDRIRPWFRNQFQIDRICDKFWNTLCPTYQTIEKQLVKELWYDDEAEI